MADQGYGFVACFLGGSLTKHRQHVASRAIIKFSAHPGRPHAGNEFLIPPPGPVGRLITQSRGAVLHIVIQAGVRQRAENRLGVLPADELEQPPAMAYKNRFMTDGTEIASPKSIKELVDLVGPRRAHESGDSRIRVLF